MLNNRLMDIQQLSSKIFATDASESIACINRPYRACLISGATVCIFIIKLRHPERSGGTSEKPPGEKSHIKSFRKLKKSDPISKCPL